MNPTAETDVQKPLPHTSFESVQSSVGPLELTVWRFSHYSAACNSGGIHNFDVLKRHVTSSLKLWNVFGKY